MVRKSIQLYCDQEHGCGDFTFPEDGTFQYAITTAAHMRREARKVGWRRYQGVDYCPTCVALDEEREGN